MQRTLSKLTALLVSVTILLTGHGLQLTLLPLHAQALGWSTYAIGTSGAAYFLGFVVGCVLIPSIVAGVGHIRTFMVMSAIATIALLAAGVFSTVPAWLLLRAATGFALSGLYMVIESWLNEVAAPAQRGRVLAVYSMISLAGMAAGQVLMAYSSPLDLNLFIGGGILLCLAIVPVGLMRVESPPPLPHVSFKPGVLVKASRIAVVGALFGGLVTGAFWSLAPVVGAAFGLQPGAIGGLMGAGILGGALAQFPIGRLSDHLDRRLVIAGVLAAGAVVALAAALFATESRLLFYGAILLLGATTMPIYALCIVHASDTSDLPLIEVTSGVLIMHSAGSIAGPIIVATLIDVFGAPSYFYYILVCLTLVSIWAFRRHFAERLAPGVEYTTAMLPRTTQSIVSMTEDAGPGDGVEAASGQAEQAAPP